MVELELGVCLHLQSLMKMLSLERQAFGAVKEEESYAGKVRISSVPDLLCDQKCP